MKIYVGHTNISMAKILITSCVIEVSKKKEIDRNRNIEKAPRLEPFERFFLAIPIQTREKIAIEITKEFNAMSAGAMLKRAKILRTIPIIHIISTSFILTPLFSSFSFI
jgi:hypothetical protein